MLLLEMKNVTLQKNANKGDYPKFYNAIKGYYPDIKIISNYDESMDQLDHPTDLYDFHVKFLMQLLHINR
ncbi:hypothetical protein Pint_19448 [Pistacia integerrima]|uniref:Uncharacterized protein n=1 Tax=Pistacia integerrima TaxID=434235 RepID=A0ACC0YXX0_9ROSI|nr:hypothetical protein Pint_19448 [Pistacia integerrima]